MKEVNLNSDERTAISRLSECLGLNLSKAELKKVETVKKVLRLAWEKDKEKLHDWGISRLRVSYLCSRISGFNHYILKRSDSIQNVLMT
jgi:hypothetical protein